MSYILYVVCIYIHIYTHMYVYIYMPNSLKNLKNNNYNIELCALFISIVALPYSHGSLI